MIAFPQKERYDVQDLRQVVEHLRGEEGCPWDRIQTHESLRRNLLEECAELCEAIDRQDGALLREELGDVLLQVIFHASIEAQEGRFDLDDVADAECRKMLSRHPHVFGDKSFSDVEQELAAWEIFKRREKHQRTPAEAMDAVCRTLPGLWRAEKLQKKAGEDARSADREALGRALAQAAAALGEALSRPEPEDAALGELLYQTVRAARAMEMDPEEALHAHCERVIRERFAREWAADADAPREE